MKEKKAVITETGLSRKTEQQKRMHREWACVATIDVDSKLKQESLGAKAYSQTLEI